MDKAYSKWFIRVNWITLIFIFLVTVAGSFVRITGSGMGCPDWPKCFGQYIPPVDASGLPANYKEIYATKRAKKVVKFAKILNAVGFKDEAQRILQDKSLLVEQDFSASKAWTEYINRLFGVMAGNGILLVFIWILRRYRTRKLVILASVNLVILMFQAWFGSIVVATNLVPWTITIHLFLALVIIVLELLILLEISPSQRRQLQLPPAMRWIIGLSFLITLVQMFLGTQVREYIDLLTQQGYGRASWTEKLGLAFYIHRSFSWLVLAMLVLLFWLNFKGPKEKIVYTAFIVLVTELVSGVLLAYADMPGLVQTSHLIFATILFGILFMATMRQTGKTRQLTA
jgi:cytochrome c oxidase assembly protein subunit 15